MTASRLSVPPPFVPTLTEVVSCGLAHPADAGAQASMSAAASAYAAAAPGPHWQGPPVEQLLQRLQDDLAVYLSHRLQEQAPLWAAEWARSLGPELRDWAHQAWRELQEAQLASDADPDKP